MYVVTSIFAEETSRSTWFRNYFDAAGRTATLPTLFFMCVYKTYAIFS